MLWFIGVAAAKDAESNRTLSCTSSPGGAVAVSVDARLTTTAPFGITMAGYTSRECTVRSMTVQ